MRIKRKNKTPALDFGLLGKVSIGKRHEQKGYPVSLDYFRFRPVQENGNRTFVDLAEKLYPHSKEAPRNLLRICFSSDSDDNFTDFYEIRDYAGRLIARTNYHIIEIAATDSWHSWFKKNAAKVKTAQTKLPGYYLFTDGLEFGEGLLFGPMKDFIDTMEQRAKAAAKKAAISSGKDQYKTQKAVEAVAWQERLILRFVLVNFPSIGRWEFSTKGKASTIKEIINAYDAVQHHRGTIVGTQFVLKVDKIKSQDKTKQYPVVTMAPLLTPEEVNSGNLLLNSVNMHTNGLMLDSGQISTDEGIIDDGEVTDFEEV